MHLTLEALSFLILVAFVAGGIDALAGGGGLLTVPVLLAAEAPPVAALATNRLQSTIGTGSTVIAYLRAGRNDLRTSALSAIGAFVASALAATAVQHVNRLISRRSCPSC
jgi:uncharacterized membrane protein YfcA